MGLLSSIRDVLKWKRVWRRIGMKTAIWLSGLLMLSTQAQAALSPNYQRARELTAVIEAVASAFPDRLVDKVQFVEDDKYEVTAGACRVIVTLETKPIEPGLVGPRQFDAGLPILSVNKCRNFWAAARSGFICAA